MSHSVWICCVHCRRPRAAMPRADRACPSSCRPRYFDAARSASANGVMSRGRPRTSFLGQTAPGKLSSTISPGRPPKNGRAPILYRCQDSNRLTAAPDNAAPSAVPATALACESPIGQAARASVRSVDDLAGTSSRPWRERSCSSSAFASAIGELLLESHDQIAAALHNGRGFFLPCLLLKQSNPIGLAHGRFLQAGQFGLDRVKAALIVSASKSCVTAAARSRPSLALVSS